MNLIRIGIVVYCVIAAAMVISGCGGGSSPAFSNDGTGPEPTGGQFLPVILSSADVIPVAAPPAANSAQTAQEIQELRTIQGQRQSPVLQSKKQLTTTQSRDTANFWNTGACTRWNEIARSLVIKYSTNPPKAARVYALVSVAQYDALVVAYRNKYLYNRLAPGQVDRAIDPLVTTTGDPCYPSEHASAAAASCFVLANLFPQETNFLISKATEDEESRLFAGVNYRSDITAGDQLGTAVARAVMERAQSDRSDQAGTQIPIPTGPGFWVGTNPLLPQWGQVRPWLMSAGNQFRPGPPPAFGSPEFNAALQEVRQISDTRTADQLRIALFWADGAGTFTPPGHWNQIASDLMTQRHLNEIRCGRTLALMNMAVMDAGICCWDAKYVYWLIRPWMADPAITTPPGKPNFPSYTSGHSTFSGAAGDVLGYIFPDQLTSLRAMADEAALSRLYGGIHYRFDNDIGRDNGRAIAQLAIARGRSDGSP